LSDRPLILDVGPARAWTNGRISAFVKRHAFFQDQGSSGLVTTGVVVLAGAFFIEFTLRLYDAPSRRSYLRQHWLDIVTCIPVVGPFRALRLVRLVAFVRIGATAREYGVGASASDRLPGGAGLWVLAPILIIVWLAASYGYYELEGGVNPHIKTFADAMYFAFVTASTVGYGDVTPVTPEGKVLTGILIFLGIGLLGFASAQLTAKLLPQRNEVAELRTSLDRQAQLLQELNTRLETVTGLLERRPDGVLSAADSLDAVSRRL
jgi:voltage-gated potassium channel